jgi:tetratricopeptide (TPR) repeat protein
VKRIPWRCGLRAAALCLAALSARAQAPAPEPPHRAQLSAQAEARARVAALYSEALRLENKEGAAAALPAFLEIVRLDPSIVEVQLKIALHYFQTGRGPDALTHLTRAMEANPKSLEIQSATAYANRLLKNDPEALRLARQILATDPGQLTAYRVILEIYAEQQNFTAMDGLIQQALQTAHALPPFWTGLARFYAEILTKTRRLTNAEIAARLIPLYQKSIAEEPTAETLVALAECEIARSNPAEARTHLEHALRLESSSVEIMIRLANVEAATGHRKKALALYEQAYERNPDFPKLRELLVNQYLADRQESRAVELLEEMVRRMPTRAELYQMLGRLYEKMSALEKTKEKKLATLGKAEENYRRALLLDSNGAEPYLLLSLVQIYREKPAEALQTLAAARTRFPTSARVAYVEAVAHRLAKDYSQALACFEQAETLAQNGDADLLNAVFYMDWATAQDQAKRSADAEATLKKALARFPNHDGVHNMLAYLWAVQGVRLQEALALSKNSLAQEPNNPAYLDTLGWIFYKMGRPREALPLLETALDFMRKQTGQVVDLEIQEHLGEVYQALGRRRDAATQWSQVLEKDPDNAKAKAAMGTPQPQ